VCSMDNAAGRGCGESQPARQTLPTHPLVYCCGVLQDGMPVSMLRIASRERPIRCALVDYGVFQARPAIRCAIRCN
jgi:hypothetical protein